MQTTSLVPALCQHLRPDCQKTGTATHRSGHCTDPSASLRHTPSSGGRSTSHRNSRPRNSPSPTPTSRKACTRCEFLVLVTVVQCYGDTFAVSVLWSSLASQQRRRRPLLRAGHPGLRAFSRRTVPPGMRQNLGTALLHYRWLPMKGHDSLHDYP